MKPDTRQARIAGALYLVIALFGGFSIGYVPSVIVEAADPAATAANLAANMGLFHAGILADIVVILVEVVLTALVFVLFAPVSKVLSLTAAFARLSMVVIMAVILLFNVAPMFLLDGAGAFSGADPAVLETVAYGFFQAHDMGTYVWQLFFALHLLALGYMIVRSHLVPPVLGWMMLVGSFGYSLQAIAKLTATQNAALDLAIIGLLTLVTLGELAFALYLLFRGVRAEAGATGRDVPVQPATLAT